MDNPVDDGAFSTDSRSTAAPAVDNPPPVHRACGRPRPALARDFGAYPQSTAPTTTSTVIHTSKRRSRGTDCAYQS
jgi:hypothetical protein